MHYDRLIIPFVLVLACLVPVPSLAEEDRWLIGAVYPLTGPAAHLGESNRRGATLAVDWINNSGGINGQLLELVVEDNRSEPAAGVSAFRNVASVQRAPVVLTTLTSVAMALRPVADSQKVVVIAESTHPKLIEDSEYTFRHFFTGESAAEALKKFIRAKNYGRIALLHAAEEFGEAAADAFESQAKDAEIKIVARETFLKTDSDLRPQLLRIRQTKPDFLYIIGIGSPVAIAARQIKELGIKTQVAGYVTCGQSQVIDSAGAHLDGTYSVEPFLDKKTKAYKELAARHQVAFPGERIDQSTIAAFDAVSIIATAFRNGARTGPEIQQFLRTALGSVSSAMGRVNFSFSQDSVVPMVVSVINKGECAKIAA